MIKSMWTINHEPLLPLIINHASLLTTNLRCDSSYISLMLNHHRKEVRFSQLDTGQRHRWTSTNRLGESSGAIPNHPSPSIIVRCSAPSTFTFTVNHHLQSLLIKLNQPETNQGSTVFHHHLNHGWVYRCWCAEPARSWQRRETARAFLKPAVPTKRVLRGRKGRSIERLVVVNGDWWWSMT